MSIDSETFVPLARRLIRRELADLMPRDKTARDEFVASEAQSLAYALAEVAEQRLDDTRGEIRLYWQGNT